MYVTCRHGLTFTNLCLNVKRFITTAEDFFEDITTKFPALLQIPLGRRLLSPGGPAGSGGRGGRAPDGR